MRKKWRQVVFCSKFESPSTRWRCIRKLQNLFPAILNRCWSFVNWNELIVFLLPTHGSNGTRLSIVDDIIKTLEAHRHQIAVKVYNEHLGTPNTDKKFLETRYLTIGAKKHILLNKKEQQSQIAGKISKLPLIDKNSTASGGSHFKTGGQLGRTNCVEAIRSSVVDLIVGWNVFLET